MQSFVPDDRESDLPAVTVHQLSRDAFEDDREFKFARDDARRGELGVDAETFADCFEPAETILGTTDPTEAYEAAQGFVVNQREGARHMVPSASAGDVLEARDGAEREFYRVARVGFEALDLDLGGDHWDDSPDDGRAHGGRGDPGMSEREFQRMVL